MGCRDAAAAAGADASACSTAQGSPRIVTLIRLGGRGVCLPRDDGCLFGGRRREAATEATRMESEMVHGGKGRRR